MAKRLTHSILAVAGLVALLFLSCCKQPMQPVEEPKLNFNEPDTIKSFVSFTLTSPLRTAYRWEGKLPSDTLSKGAVNSLGMINSAGARTRVNVIITDGVNFSHAIKSNFCSLYLSKASELLTQDFIRPNDNVLDALRSWRGTTIEFFVNVPQHIQVPFKITNSALDSALILSFSDKRYQEQFVYGNTPTTWSILSFVSDIFGNVKYSPKYLKSIDSSGIFDPASLNLYRTRLERAEFYLDRYDTTRQRVDGRFSFRIVGFDGSIVDIQNGSFVNVRLTRQNE
jgi:hypothetical protein